jgi:hypothetical protein
MDTKLRDTLLLGLAAKGADVDVAAALLNMADAGLETLDELVNSTIEKSRAQTIQAYVSAAATLLQIEGYEVLGKDLLDVSKVLIDSIFSDVEDGDEDGEEAQPVTLTPTAPVSEK